MKKASRIFFLLFLSSYCEKIWAEPGYQGKTLSIWLDEYGAGPRNYRPSPEADDALRHIGPEAVPYLLHLLHSTNSSSSIKVLPDTDRFSPPKPAVPAPASWDHWKAYVAFQALGPLGKSAVPDLAKLAQDDPNGTSYYPNIRGMKDVAMVARLADNSGSYVVPGDSGSFHGQSLRRDTKPFLVDGEIAAWSLAAIGADAIPSLMDLLDDPNPRFKMRAAEALGMVGAPAEPAVPTLVKLLGSSDFAVRQRVADSLGEIGQRPNLVVPALIGIINDPGYGVGSIAAESLGKFGERATNAIPALLEGMKSGPYLVKPAAAIALSKISPETARKEVIPILVGDLKGRGSHNSALITLSQMQDEADLVIPAIIGALDDSERMVQHNAINMLGRFGPQAKAAVPKLISLATDQSIQNNPAYDMREDATNALDKIDPGWRTRN